MFKQIQENKQLIMIFICIELLFLISSTTSLRCWFGYSTVDLDGTFRNFYNDKANRICYTAKRKGEDGLDITLYDNQLSNIPSDSEWIKECYTDFCNEPPHPSPM